MFQTYGIINFHLYQTILVLVLRSTAVLPLNITSVIFLILNCAENTTCLILWLKVSKFVHTYYRTEKA